MEIKKPPALPPDTGPCGGDPPPSVLHESAGHNRAENPELLDSEMPDTRRTQVPIIATLEHPVIFTVLRDVNAIRFLSELLRNLLLLDPTARILPTMEAHSSYLPLGRTSAFPTNVSEAKTFAIAYLAGLKVASERDMKGKVIIQTRTKFSTFKQNRNFREWLDGSETAPVRPKIMMTRTDLPGNVRVSAGFFFNVVARHDTAKNFQKQITDSLSASGRATGTIPDFQIEVFTSGGDGGRSRLYRMFASSVQNVSILTEKMAMIMPKPSMDIFYIPQKVWTALEASKKKEYLVMQAEFDKSHNSRVLTGLKNTKLQLPRATAGGAKAESAQGFSIYTWLTRVQANNGYTMFPKVFECDNGDVELWFHMSHEKEAGAWMSTALAEIARLSGIELVSNRRSAEAMFVNPDKVWTSLDKLNNGVSLPAQRSVYMDFSPPMGIVTFPTRPNMSRRQRKRPSQLQLVFDIEAASTVSVSRRVTPGQKRRESHVGTGRMALSRRRALPHQRLLADLHQQGRRMTVELQRRRQRN